MITTTPLAELTEADIIKNLPDKAWRLRHFYKITTKDAEVVAFQPNEVQQKIFDNLFKRNVILKARQAGVTTGMCIWMLDEVLFTDNLAAGIIAHTQPDAQRFYREKILFAYDRLPDIIRKMIYPIKRDGGTLELSNGSTISVGTSARSMTVQILHISEYGKICSKYPDKAEEIRSGAFPAVPSTGLITIESTAEGQDGDFYSICCEAKKIFDAGKEPHRREFMLHFFPWYDSAEYQENPQGVIFNESMVKYFDSLESQGITLSNRQKAWYVLTKKEQGANMLREYPSTFEEAFQANLEGKYYTDQFTWLRQEGRICDIPHEENIGYATWWDLGFSDDTAIWVTQSVGKEVRCIDFYKNHGHGFSHYFNWLIDKGYLEAWQFNNLAIENGIVIRDTKDSPKRRPTRFIGPHDLNVHDLVTGENRVNSILKNFGIKFESVERTTSIQHDIEAVRQFLTNCWFDEVGCNEGITDLEMYGRQWNERLQVWSDKPRHDKYSHGHDAFRTLAIGHSLFLNSNIAFGNTSGRNIKRPTPRRLGSSL